MDRKNGVNQQESLFEIHDRDPQNLGLRGPSEAWSRESLDLAAAEAREFVSIQTETIHQAARQMADVDFPFVGNSPLMLRVFDLINKVADTDSTVLILGESGTGKELVAKAVHYRSNRRMKPFVPVNCGAIPSELLESELFGHVKGAFTGAHSNRIGRFSLAHQGTLFLDEIGTMPPSLQVKLLRALQEREFEPVGSTKSLRSDCRVVAATNIDLEREVQRGSFREDLYYRLNVIPVHLPPIRERREDIPLLVDHFIKKFNDKKNCQIDGMSPQVLQVFTEYHWPGNVREIENICQRLCILKGQGVIEVEDLPPKIRQPRAVGNGTHAWSPVLANGFPEGGIPLDQIVEKFENDLILKALENTRWNKNKAAQMLQMNRTTLVEKIKKRGLAPLN